MCRSGRSHLRSDTRRDQLFGMVHNHRMSNVRIESLADRPELLPTVAEWHWNEWGDVDPSGSLQSWAEGLASRTHRDRIPASYVAVADGEPVGSVVLVEHDMPDRGDLAHLTLWLAGLFVKPAYRHQGIGSALVRHAQSEALRFGVSRLYLYTSTASDVYKRLGWKTIGGTVYEGEDVAILVSDLSDAGEAATHNARIATSQNGQKPSGPTIPSAITHHAEWRARRPVYLDQWNCGARGKAQQPIRVGG